MRGAGAVALACVLATVGATGAWAQDSCDRPCLESMLARYVDARVARAPSQLPIAPSTVLTENGQQLELGDGWSSA